MMMSKKSALFSVVVSLGIASVVGLVGCSAGRPKVAAEGKMLNPPADRDENLERLARLHTRRTADDGDRDYVLGSGDVLALRAFDFDELNRQVRVDGEGTVTLPLLGVVPVGGLTVAEAQDVLTEGLGRYMYDPNVTVFVQEYRSQQVAVMGAVEHPGLVSLTKQDATVLDAISEAGGMTASAYGRIYLMPAEERQEVDPDPLRNVLRKIRDGMPIMLDSKEAPQGIERFFFSLPVRGGDVIMVPNSGQFIVEGWVSRPGTYPLQPGLRLRGALATAGGLRFPANSKRIRIYRLTPNGDTKMQEVNYKDIVAQRAADTFIHEGDVITVASSGPKLVPYSFYKLVTDLIRVGARIPLVP